MSEWRWGRRSMVVWAELDPDLRQLADVVLAASPFDLSLTEGHRSEAAQTLAFNEELSKLKWPESKHNTLPARAMHLDPYPIDYDQWRLYYMLAGIVVARAEQLGIGVRWGGDWDQDFDLNDQTFNDLAHWELTT